MGKTTDAFKREIGKNTGKAVSTFIFGDKHATPHRISIRAAKAEAIAKEADEKPRRVREESEARLRQEEIIRKKEYLYGLEKDIRQEVGRIAAMKIPDKKDELIEWLLDSSFKLKATRWNTTGEEGRIKNALSDAALEKYERGLKQLKKLDPNDPQLEYFQKIKDRTSIKRFIKIYRALIVIASIILLAAIVLGVMFLVDKDLKWVLVAIAITVVLPFVLTAALKRQKRRLRQG